MKGTACLHSMLPLENSRKLDTDGMICVPPNNSDENKLLCGDWARLPGCTDGEQRTNIWTKFHKVSITRFALAI